MKKIIIKNDKILKHLSDIKALATDVGNITDEIEKLDVSLKENDAKQREITTKVEPEELIAQGKEIQEKVNKLLEELDLIGDQIVKAKIDAIPEEMKNEYFDIKGKIEVLEEERNKKALKVQKIKDKVIPMMQKEVKPQLEEYEDIENYKLLEDSIEFGIFSHLEEWKENFKKKRK